MTRLASLAFLLLLFGCGGTPDDPALIRAAQKQDANRLEELLDKGGNVNAQDRYGATPLMIAAYNGDKESVRVLLAHGADTRHTDNNGNTAYSVAETQGQMEIAELIGRP